MWVADVDRSRHENMQLANVDNKCAEKIQSVEGAGARSRSQFRWSQVRVASHVSAGRIRVRRKRHGTISRGHLRSHLACERRSQQSEKGEARINESRPVGVHIAFERRPRQSEKGEERWGTQGYRSPSTEGSHDREHATCM